MPGLASAYLGATVPTVPDLVKQANPISYISKDAPPFLVQKGDQDCTVPIENTKMLADALTAAGQDVQFDLLAGEGARHYTAPTTEDERRGHFTRMPELRTGSG